VTADRDAVPDDPWRYRVALIDAFRKRGIFAPGVTNLSEDSLAWPGATELEAFEGYDAAWLVQHLRQLSDWLRFEDNRREIDGKTRGAAAQLHNQLTVKPEKNLYRFGELCGLVLDPDKAPPDIERDARGIPKFEVHQFRTAFRARPDGTLLNHVVLTLTQRRCIELPDGQGTYDFRGGATLILDLASMRLRYCIRSPITDETRRMDYQSYIMEDLPAAIRLKFFKPKSQQAGFEPFAFLHGENWEEHDHA
jgi:hypothetical protein